MTGLYVLLLAASFAVAALAKADRRAVGWLAAAQASFWLSVLYWDLQLPHGEVFGFATNFVVCAALYRFAKFRWELWVFALFMLMMITDILFLSGQVIPAIQVHKYVFSWTLFILNLAMVMTIGAVFSFKDVGRELGHAFQPWRTVFGRVRHVYSGQQKGR